MKKKYKAAVIGCGNIGVEVSNYKKEVQPATHAGAYQNHPKVELAGLVDLNPKRLDIAARYFPGVLLFRSSKEMLEKVKPDIVSVATHPGSHSELVKMAAQHKTKAIVCEKPIAETIKEGEEMIKICKKTGSLLFINHTRRFDPLFRKEREEIKRGKLGRVLQATYYYYNGIFNNGTHLVDLLRFFLGEIDWVLGIENKNTKNPNLKNDINIDATLHFKNGTIAAIQSLPPNYGFSEFYFYGERGGLFFRNLGYEIEYRRLVKNKYYKGYYQMDSKSKFYGKIRSFMISMVDHVVKCLDKKERPISTGEDGLAALKIIFALKESAKNNGKFVKLI